MRGGVADDLQPIGILVGDDRQRSILRNQMRGIYQMAVYFAGQRGTRQTRAYAKRNISNRHSMCKAALRTIRQSNNNCLLYTSPSPRDRTRSRMPSSA